MNSKKEILGVAAISVAIVTIAIALAINARMHREPTNLPTAPEQKTSAVFRKILPYERMMRVYWVHVPSSYDGSHRIPLVLALHGAGGDGCEFERGSGWVNLSEENGFLVVCPTGSISVPTYGYRWNVYNWDASMTNTGSPDDVGFLMVLINQLKNDYMIDSTRVYMTGYSNGASMTNTFAFKYTDVLAAIAPVSGRWMTSEGIDPYGMSQPDAPIPVYIWRGEKETSQTGNQTRDVQDQLQKQYWIDWNKVNKTSTNVIEGFYRTEIYAGGDAEVRFTEIIGRDHDTYDLNTATMIWYDFFQRFSRDTLTAHYDFSPSCQLLTNARVLLYLQTTSSFQHFVISFSWISHKMQSYSNRSSLLGIRQSFPHEEL